MLKFSCHPSVDNGITPGVPGFKGGKLYCHCEIDPVEVTLESNVWYNHLCGCVKCWKPSGAAFSMVGMIPKKNLSVTAHVEKLGIIDHAATIRRHACMMCGVHMFGRIKQEHPFKGFDFVHVELSDEKGWQEPQFAAYIIEIISNGFPSEYTKHIYEQLLALGLDTYERLPSELRFKESDWKDDRNEKTPEECRDFLLPQIYMNEPDGIDTLV